nr:MAG TPA: hypothetical protein [Caudoviricetes sp.]
MKIVLFLVTTALAVVVFVSMFGLFLIVFAVREMMEEFE